MAVGARAVSAFRGFGTPLAGIGASFAHYWKPHPARNAFVPSGTARTRLKTRISDFNGRSPTAPRAARQTFQTAAVGAKFLELRETQIRESEWLPPKSYALQLVKPGTETGASGELGFGAAFCEIGASFAHYWKPRPARNAFVPSRTARTRSKTRISDFDGRSPTAPREARQTFQTAAVGAKFLELRETQIRESEWLPPKSYALQLVKPGTETGAFGELGFGAAFCEIGASFAHYWKPRPARNAFVPSRTARTRPKLKSRTSMAARRPRRAKRGGFHEPLSRKPDS